MISDRRKFLRLVGGTGAGTLIGSTAGCTQEIGGQDAIQFGGILPLSGSAGGAGRWVRRGWQMWVDQLNKSDGLLGREVELTVYDHETDTSKMQSLVSKLIQEDNVDVLLGSYLSLAFPIVSQAAQRNQMATICCFPTASYMTQKQENSEYRPYVFGLSLAFKAWPQYFINEFLMELPKDKRPQTIAIASGNDAFGKANAQFSARAAEQNGIEVVANQFYERSTSSLSPLMRKIKQEEPDGLMGGTYPGDAILMKKAADDVGLDPDFIWQFVGTQFPSVIKALGEQATNLYGNTVWAPATTSDANQDIVSTARENWDGEPPYTFGMGLMQMQIFEQAIESAGSLKQDELRSELESGNFETISGQMKFQDLNIATNPTWTTQVQGQSIEIVGPKEDRTSEPGYPVNYN